MMQGKARPEIYQEQLNNKHLGLKQLFDGFSLPEISIFASPSSHFRMRAEFKIWQQDGVAAYAMYEPGVYKQARVIEEFSIGSLAIVNLMPKLLACINASDTLRKKLFQVEFLSSSKGEILATLVYHKFLDDAWLREAETLQRELKCTIVGRSRGQKRVLEKDFIYEKFKVDQREFVYQQVEASFTQPNAHVCQLMLNWATELSREIGGDLLELYCGNANFTLPLSCNFEKVLATEVAKTSVKSALHNIELNNISNVEVIRLSSEEFTQAINKQREFKRLSKIDLDSYRFSTIFVDPPRVGLDSGTVALASRFDNILYISCNPETLKKNLEVLYDTHAIKHFALFDQFPYTEHIECGVFLTKR